MDNLFSVRYATQILSHLQSGKVWKTQKILNGHRFSLAFASFYWVYVLDYVYTFKMTTGHSLDYQSVYPLFMFIHETDRVSDLITALCLHSGYLTLLAMLYHHLWFLQLWPTNPISQFVFITYEFWYLGSRSIIFSVWLGSRHQTLLCPDLALHFITLGF